ncbi:MAG: hypothetical protein FWC54_00515 [Actinomycetia bacterium]|nr:hypothetical protein [Actinomycetes bacterium]
MRALIVVAVAVVLLALLIMFVFASHQSALQDQAQNQTTGQNTQQDGSASSTGATTLGPIEVNKSTLYNRENAALGQSGPGPQSSITGAQVDIPGATSGTSGQ